MNIGSLEALQMNDKTIVLKGAEEEAVMVISAPEMMDGHQKVSTDITLSMERNGVILDIVMTADEGFLQDEETVYPVIVDPYFFVVASSEISISDTFLSSSLPSSNMRSAGVAAGSLIVGRESSTYGKSRSLLRLDTLPQLPTGSVITQAQLILKNYFHTAEISL